MKIVVGDNGRNPEKNLSRKLWTRAEGRECLTAFTTEQPFRLHTLVKYCEKIFSPGRRGGLELAYRTELKTYDHETCVGPTIGGSPGELSEELVT